MVAAARIGVMAALAVLAMPAPAQDDVLEPLVPAPRPAPRASIQGATSVGQGQSVVHLQLGWPGAVISGVWGLTPRVDVGARLGFSYATEGQLQVYVPGVKAHALVRWHAVDLGPVSLGLEAAPGLFSYFWPVEPYVGLTLPVSLRAGLGLLPNLWAHATAGADPLLSLAPRRTLDWPFRFGLGLEYRYSDRLSGTSEITMGPLFQEAAPRGQLTISALVGLALVL